MTLFIVRILLLFTTVVSVHLPARSEQETPAHSLYLLAVSLTKEDPKKSFQLLERARELSQENREDELYIKILGALGSVSLELRKEKQLGEEKQKEVFDWTNEALKTLDRSEKTSDIAQLHYNAGEFYMELTPEIDQPIYHYKTAQEIWTILDFEGKIEQIANCYHGIADIYKYKKSDFLEAEKAYEKALQLRESIDFQPWNVLFANHYSLATTNRSQSDFEKALSYGNKTLEIASKLKKSIGTIARK